MAGEFNSRVYFGGHNAALDAWVEAEIPGGHLYLSGTNQLKVTVGATPTTGYFGSFGAPAGDLFGISKTGTILLQFDVSNNKAVFPNGNVGIGTTSPGQRLSVDQRFASTPPVPAGSLQAVTQVYVEGGVGNNHDFWGEMGMYLTVRDHANVTQSNKGVLYGLNIDMYPRVDRESPPGDDVAALVICNSGAYTEPQSDVGFGADAIFVCDSKAFEPGDNEWHNVMKIEADAENGIHFVTPATTPSMTYAIRMEDLRIRSGGAAILLANNMPIASLRAGRNDTRATNLNSDP